MGQMSQDVDLAWSLFCSGDKASLNEAWRIATAVADDVARSASERAEALFLLGQLARFLQPWRSSDEGFGYFERAIAIEPGHIDSLLAMCELHLKRSPVSGADIDKVMAQVEKARSSMSSENVRQLECIVANRSKVHG